MDEIYNHIASYGELPSHFLNGDIILLSTPGEPTSPHNKRPNTLLNSCYKIYANLWQLRLSLVADTLITWNQATFFKGRSIHETMLLCNEVLHFARINHLPTIFLKVDFCKTFDSFHWDFLQEIFLHMGFGTTFANVLRSIIASSSQMLINNTRGATFKLTKAVRQGCPLSPLLVLFAMQALVNCVTFEQHANRLLVVSLPHIQLEYIQASYVDDTHFLLKVSLFNLKATKTLLHIFSIASSLAIQSGKSEARWLALCPRPLETNTVEWARKEVDDPGQLLSYSFIDGLQDDTMFTSLILKLKKNCRGGIIFRYPCMARSSSPITW